VNWQLQFVAGTGIKTGDSATPSKTELMKLNDLRRHYRGITCAEETDITKTQQQRI